MDVRQLLHMNTGHKLSEHTICQEKVPESRFMLGSVLVSEMEKGNWCIQDNRFIFKAGQE